MDTFRKEYREVTEEDKNRILDCKSYAERILLFYDLCIPKEERSERSRCMNLARTNLEQSVMWAVKALTY